MNDIRAKRRKRYDELAGGMTQASEGVIGGLRSLDDLQQRNKKEALDAEDRKVVLNAKQLEAELARGRSAREASDLALRQKQEQRHAAEAAAKAKADAAEQERKAKADEQKRADDLDREMADQNQKTFDREDEMTRHRDNLALKKSRGTGGAKPLSEKEKLDLKLKQQQIEKNEREKEAEGKPKKPTVTEAASVTDLDLALEEARKLATDKGKIDTGPVAGMRNWLAQKIDADDPEVTAFKANVGEQLASYISSISGATVSEPEREKLMENVPGFGDNDTAFMAKLNRVITMLEAKKKQQMRALTAAGRDTSSLTTMTPEQRRARIEELRAKRGAP